MHELEALSQGLDGRYPIYEQIINSFRRSLVKGEINAGDRIPSIRETAMTLRVNANTVQRSYQEMERMQLIYSQRGMGYYVMNNEGLADTVRRDMVGDITDKFVLEMKSLGFSDAQILEELARRLKGGDK